MTAKRWTCARTTGKRSACVGLAIVAAAVFVGCAGTTPELGGGGTVATGGAGGATSTNASSQLEKCSQSLGTLAVVEDQNPPWYRTLTQYRLGLDRTRAAHDDPTVELLRDRRTGPSDE